MIESSEQAIALLEDNARSEQDREEAIHYLQRHVSNVGLDVLVLALEDDDSGVRWAAGTALAVIGDDALLPLVTALASPSNSTRLREGARHVFHQSSSRAVHEQTAALQKALTGVDADLKTMQAAYALLDKLR